MLLKVELTVGLLAAIDPETIGLLMEPGREATEEELESKNCQVSDGKIGEPDVFIIYLLGVSQPFACLDNSTRGGASYEKVNEIFRACN